MATGSSICPPPPPPRPSTGYLEDRRFIRSMLIDQRRWAWTPPPTPNPSLHCVALSLSLSTLGNNRQPDKTPGGSEQEELKAVSSFSFSFFLARASTRNKVKSTHASTQPLFISFFVLFLSLSLSPGALLSPTRLARPRPARRGRQSATLSRHRRDGGAVGASQSGRGGGAGGGGVV